MTNEKTSPDQPAAPPASENTEPRIPLLELVRGIQVPKAWHERIALSPHSPGTFIYEAQPEPFTTEAIPLAAPVPVAPVLEPPARANGTRARIFKALEVLRNG